MDKPVAGQFKCNVDAFFSNSLDKIGIEVCIRDVEGNFVIAKSEWITHLLDVDWVKLYDFFFSFFFFTIMKPYDFICNAMGKRSQRCEYEFQNRLQSCRLVTNNIYGRDVVFRFYGNNQR